MGDNICPSQCNILRSDLRQGTRKYFSYKCMSLHFCFLPLGKLYSYLSEALCYPHANPNVARARRISISWQAGPAFRSTLSNYKKWPHKCYLTMTKKIGTNCMYGGQNDEKNYLKKNLEIFFDTFLASSF